MTKTEEQKQTKSKKQMKWNKKNKDKCKIYQHRYQQKNKEKINEYNKKYKNKQYYNNEQERIKQILFSRHNNFLKGNDIGFKILIGKDIDEYKKYITSILPSDCDWDNYGKMWYIKRKKNRKHFDLKKTSDQKAFMNYKNIQPTKYKKILK